MEPPDTRGHAMRFMFVFSIGLFAVGCDGAPPETERVQPTYEFATPVADASPADSISLASPIESAIPAHNYDVREGHIYSYVAAVSEDERKAGKAAGNVVSFAYLGMRGDKHVLVRVLPDGSTRGEAYCGEPCRIISYPDGGQIAFTESSIIGAAFADALAGRLEIASYAPRTPVGRLTPIPTGESAPSPVPTGERWTATEKQMIDRWMKANEDCRGSSDPKVVADACANRDDVYSADLAAADICYGREGESGYQNVMHRCEEGSLRFD